MTTQHGGSHRIGLLVLLAVFSLLCMFFSTTADAQAPAPAFAAEYRLAAGDAVRTTVYQGPHVALEARISKSGLVSYPIEVADLRLSDLLAMAGGIAANGADTVVLAGTPGGHRIRKEIDLANVFRAATAEDDLLVPNGDMVSVERAPHVYIDGEVQRPGPMRLERSLTVMQALASAGGLNQRGTDIGLRVYREGPDGKLQVLQPAMDGLLRDGDVVDVRESLFSAYRPHFSEERPS